ncbi:MAG: hypothetical protein ACU841_14100 [Gammaproteobacteria bacterium]
MKKMKAIIVSMLLAGAAGVSSSASAEGELNGSWFNTRIKTTIKKNHALEATLSPSLSVVFNNSPIKFDSGKDACFSALNWNGVGTRQYDMIVICEGAGNWERIAVVENSIEYNDGSVLFLTSLDDFFALPPEGQGIGTATQAIIFQGTVILKTSFKGNGSLKNAKLIQPVDGSTIFQDISNPNKVVIGSSGPGLKMKWVDESQVPQGAKACLASVLGGAPVVNCDPI